MGLGTILLKEIKKHDNILIFRHAFPDGDALGSQWGLFKWIKLNFPSKNVWCIGENAPGNLGRIFPKTHNIDDIIVENSLGIVCDTANTERIDTDLWTQCTNTLKIDHHPDEDQYADDQILQQNFSSTSEILAKVFIDFKNNYEYDDEIAKFLFLGIATDTGRFLFSNTTSQTLEIVSKLSQKDFDRNKVLNELYVKNPKEVKLWAHIQTEMVLDKKPVVYAILKKGIEEEFGLEYALISSSVHALKDIEGYPYYLFASWDQVAKVWKVSLRSRKHSIVNIARKHKGGGHELASGVKVKTEKEIFEIIDDLSKLK